MEHRWFNIAPYLQRFLLWIQAFLYKRTIIISLINSFCILYLALYCPLNVLSFIDANQHGGWQSAVNLYSGYMPATYTCLHIILSKYSNHIFSSHTHICMISFTYLFVLDGCCGEEGECTSDKEIYKKPHKYEQVPLYTYASPGIYYYISKAVLAL